MANVIYSWKGNSGSFNVASNWTPNPAPPNPTIPSSGDSVIFGTSLFYTATINASADISAFTLSDLSATINLTGAGVYLNTNQFTFNAGTINLNPASIGGGLNVSGAFNIAPGTPGEAAAQIQFNGNAVLSLAGSNQTRVFTQNLHVDVRSGTGTIQFNSGQNANTLQNGGWIQVSNGSNATSLTISGGLETGKFVNSGNLRADSSTLLNVTAATLENSNEIYVTNTAKAVLKANKFVNTGTITASCTLTGFNGKITFVSGTYPNSATLQNDGLIAAEQSTIDFSGQNDPVKVFGSGQLRIMDGTIVTYGGDFLNEDVQFVDGSSLGQLIVMASGAPVSTPMAAGKKIVNFGKGNSITFRSIDYASYERVVWQSTVDNVQTFAIVNPGTTMATFSLQGHFSESRFVLQAGDQGKAKVFYDALPKPAVHDFDGDGKSDLLWRSGSGLVTVGFGQNDGRFRNFPVASVDTDWRIIGVRDFDGDGKADLLWRHLNGNVTFWFANGTGNSVNADKILSNSAVVNVGLDWDFEGVGDFNGDGKADILWRNTSGVVSLWTSNPSSPGFVASVLASPDNSWSVVGVGDSNGDGRDDILWRNSSGALSVWASSRTGMQSVDLAPVDRSWSVLAFDDFNGDGKADILWRHANNDVQFWKSNKAGGFDPVSMGKVSDNWRFATVGDFNGDGVNDIGWSNGYGGGAALWISNRLGGFDSRTEIGPSDGKLQL